MREHVKLAHSHRMKRLPQPISNILTPVGRSLEARQNRYSENNLELPGPSVIAGRHFPAYKIAKAWNNLPHSIKSITLHDFEAGFAAHTANLNDRVCEKPNCPICDWKLQMQSFQQLHWLGNQWTEVPHTLDTATTCTHATFSTLHTSQITSQSSLFLTKSKTWKWRACPAACCGTIPTLCPADYCAFWRLLSRLSVEVTRAVGQGGGRDCTLLYSLRLLPEWLQAVAPGCNHYALATWIHRHSDPWLTLQVSLSIPILQYNTVLPFPRIKTVNLLNQNLRKWFLPCLLQSEIKQ